MVSAKLDLALAQQRMHDFRCAADAHRRMHHPAHAGPSVSAERSVTLRLASPADQGSLGRLAELDSSTPPAHPVLLAEVDGRLLAALGLPDDTAVADPFHRTADLVDLLRARAHQLDGNRRMRRAGRLPSWSRVRALAWR
jgi:hypothetical protein